ncbi:MAG: hypothetical protein QM714_16225 [Nocardioides sp.]|uniref:hypothetical protein n=1 Tax=Nocardioides sp. TaxID=35761 RepID=UPI0039E625BB
MSSVAPIRVAVVGLGKVGVLVARMCLDRPDLELQGGVVTTPTKAGVDIGLLLDREPVGVTATEDLEEVAADTDVDAIVYCGLGDPVGVAATLGRLAERGKDCVTVSGLIHPETALGESGAAALDAQARGGGSRVVGAGWNPGFLLDLLPVVWGNSIPGVQSVAVERICDLAAWGDGVLDRLGIGSREAIPVDSWTEYLPVSECLRLVSDALRLDLDCVELRFEPRVATDRRSVAGRRVEPGTTMGFRATGVGLKNGAEVVRLGWNAVFGLDPAVDELVESALLVIRGETDVEVVATGTTLLDAYPATAARALNTLWPLRELPPGLYRPDQVPASAWTARPAAADHSVL